jgi:NAD(P)-dependent dehydrogenase (short-subunit alcohol dehydrogenase family)
MSKEIAVIVGGGPGVSASCARLFSKEDMTVVVAARNPDKPVLKTLAEEYGVITHACDASDSDSVTALFENVKTEFGAPNLVIHNIDGRMREIFRKRITEAEPKHFTQTVLNSTLSAFLVGQQAAIGMLENPMQDSGRGTIIFTNASAAKKGFPLSGAFATACHGKAGLAESMARELMPQGIHVASVPIDAAIGWTQEDGSRAHWAAGKTEEDNMADPDFIAETYLQIHRQHRSTWTHEVILRPWVEKW